MYKNLSIIIPVYNEERRIGKTLTELFKFLKEENYQPEIIVVDDGSTDKTARILKQYFKKIKIISVVPNRGKGNAIKTGMLTASGDFILFMDADLATPLFEIPEILLAMDGHEFDIAIGSRNLRSKDVQRTLLRSITSKFFSFISHLLIPLNYEDTQCGFKVFKRKPAKEIFSQVKVERWAFDLEVLFLADKMGFRVFEYPVKWREMPGSKVKMLKDGFLIIKDLIAIRLFNLTQTYNFHESEERSYNVLRQQSKEAKEL